MEEKPLDQQLFDDHLLEALTVQQKHYLDTVSVLAKQWLTVRNSGQVIKRSRYITQQALATFYYIIKRFFYDLKSLKFLLSREHKDCQQNKDFSFVLILRKVMMSLIQKTGQVQRAKKMS